MVYLLVTNNEPFISLSPAETCNSDEAHCATSRIRKAWIVIIEASVATMAERGRSSSIPSFLYDTMMIYFTMRTTVDTGLLGQETCYVIIDSQERFVPLFLFFGTGGEWNKIYWFYGRKYIRSNWNRKFFFLNILCICMIIW